jgi:hypothetical protein
MGYYPPKNKEDDSAYDFIPFHSIPPAASMDQDFASAPC